MDKHSTEPDLKSWMLLLAEEMVRPSETVMEVRVVVTEKMQKEYNESVIDYARECFETYRLYKMQVEERNKLGNVVSLNIQRETVILDKMISVINERNVEILNITNLLKIDLKNVLPTLPQDVKKAFEMIEEFLRNI